MVHGEHSERYEALFAQSESLWREALLWHHGPAYDRYLRELARRNIELRVWTAARPEGRSREEIYAAARRAGHPPAEAAVLWAPGRPVAIVLAPSLHHTGQRYLETVLYESIRLTPVLERGGVAWAAALERREALEAWLIATGAVALGERLGAATPGLRWRQYLALNTVEWQRERGWVTEAEQVAAWREGRRRAAVWAGDPASARAPAPTDSVPDGRPGGLSVWA